jgi:hypothetical protein
LSNPFSFPLFPFPDFFPYLAVKIRLSEGKTTGDDPDNDENGVRGGSIEEAETD